MTMEVEVLLILAAVIGVALYLLYARLGNSRFHDLMADLTTWVIFSVAFALLPIVLNAFLILSVENRVTVDLLLRNGELFLISGAIAADATGRLVSANINERLPKIAFVGLCVIILAISSGLFSIASFSSDIPPTMIASTSIMVFQATMAVCSLSVLLSSEAMIGRSNYPITIIRP